MAPSPSDEAVHDAMVRAAISHAEASAGRDNAFLKAFREHFHAARLRATRHLRVVSGAGAPRGGVGSAGPRSFHIFDDPRYLRNARDLARRTLGGTRVVGGAAVKAGQFPDCVAVGNDAQWGCTGTLIAPNVVVTAGHCADFATRVFFGNDVGKAGTVVRVKKRVRHPKYHQGKHNDLMVRFAATSRATDSAQDNCGDGGIYVRLDKYRKWIDAIPGVALG